MRRKKSCRSHGEREISEFLLENNVPFYKEVKFDTCRNDKGNLLRFDFYIVGTDLLIEYQGIHHYKPINKYNRAKRVHETTKIHDQIKKEFCQNNGWKLICIPYWERNKIKDILISLLGDRICKPQQLSN